MEDGVGTV